MMRILCARVSLVLLFLLIPLVQTSSSSAAGIFSAYFFEARGNSGYDAVLIQTPNGTNIVIDSGADLSDNAFSRFLREHGVGRIDVLIASNSGAGYVGLHDSLIWQFGRSIGKIIDVGQPSSSSQYREFIETACANGIPIEVARDGDTLHWGSVKATFYSPSTDQVPWRSQEQICSPDYQAGAVSNETHSLVFKVEYENISFLFTGELGGAELDALMGRHAADLQSTVLKLPRHGGEMGNSRDSFLDAVAAKVAVAMASPFDSFGRPCDSLLERLAELKTPTYITGIHGTISMITDGQSNFIETQNPITSDPSELINRNSSVGDC